MLKEAIQHLIETGENRKRIIPAPDHDATGRFYQVLSDGQLYEVIPYQPHPEITVGSTRALAELIQHEIANDQGTITAEVWYSPNGVTALLRDEDPEDHSVRYRRHHLPLPRHPAFDRARTLSHTEHHSQLSLIRMLRAEFNGHVDPDIIERFRALRLTTDGSGLSVVRQGNASIDRRLAQQAQDEHGGGIPEEVTISVPVYDLDEARNDEHDIVLLTDAVPHGDEVRFDITSVHNTLADAERDALDNLLERLDDHLAPLGVPIWRAHTPG